MLLRVFDGSIFVSHRTSDRHLEHQKSSGSKDAEHLFERGSVFPYVFENVGTRISRFCYPRAGRYVSRPCAALRDFPDRHSRTRWIAIPATGQARRRGRHEALFVPSGSSPSTEQTRADGAPMSRIPDTWRPCGMQLCFRTARSDSRATRKADSISTLGRGRLNGENACRTLHAWPVTNIDGPDADHRDPRPVIIRRSAPRL